jgi:hypothetical protein
MEVVVYHKRVGLLVDELINYNTQVIKLLEFVGQADSNLVGAQKIKIYEGLLWGTTQKTTTLEQQMELIRIYLKKIEREELSIEEQVLFTSAECDNGLIWHNMVDFMEPLIHWLKNIIEYYSNK